MSVTFDTHQLPIGMPYFCPTISHVGLSSEHPLPIYRSTAALSSALSTKHNAEDVGLSSRTGDAEGTFVGEEDGMVLGDTVGDLEGTSDGKEDGVVLGDSVGGCVG